MKIVFKDWTGQFACGEFEYIRVAKYRSGKYGMVGFLRGSDEPIWFSMTYKTEKEANERFAKILDGIRKYRFSLVDVEE
jgi:hypothetical protein